MLFTIVYLPLSFLFYWSDLECILCFLFICVSSLCGFLSFCALAFVGFLFYKVRRLFSCYLVFFLTSSNFHGTLHLALVLVDMYSATAFIWVLTKFLHLSFRICISDFSWKVLNFLVPTYLLFISLLVSDNQSKLVVLTISYFCADSGVSLLFQFCDWKILLQKRSRPHSSKYYLSTSCL